MKLLNLFILMFRSPSDYRSLDCDSLSVDDGGSEGETNVSTTVIQIGGGTDHIPSIDDDEEEEGGGYSRRTLQTEVSRIEALMYHEINPSIYSALAMVAYISCISHSSAPHSTNNS